ncbi:hypothetical protein ISF_03077 [Cordyceps fumosorosea ARSEF 2679]|uniref:Uncharacterized protein n=1 Tax=Cordyceps fumosorosea (strain ARSEF 2679) TaxID=1081104 RepID=A0A168B9G4_CORFA|nr:hypothetical protein ISF_03077 [Cordyceps fumosorosea ARSEF 2679]OAA69807.1 hypothetical protein ISF_03077 [Cordyceps fumosorosea ARSEF 2679]
MAQVTYEEFGGEWEPLYNIAPFPFTYDCPGAPPYPATHANVNQTDRVMFLDVNSDSPSPQLQSNGGADQQHESFRVCYYCREGTDTLLFILHEQMQQLQAEVFMQIGQARIMQDLHALRNEVQARQHDNNALRLENQELRKKFEQHCQSLGEELEQNCHNLRNELQDLKKDLRENQVAMNSLLRVLDQRRIVDNLTPGWQSQPPEAWRAENDTATEMIQEPKIAEQLRRPQGPLTGGVQSSSWYSHFERDDESFALPQGQLHTYSMDVDQSLQDPMQYSTPAPGFLSRRLSSDDNPPFGAVGDRPGHAACSPPMLGATENTPSSSQADATAAYYHGPAGLSSRPPTLPSTQGEGEDDARSLATSADSRASDGSFSKEGEVGSQPASPDTEIEDAPSFLPVRQQEEVGGEDENAVANQQTSGDLRVGEILLLLAQVPEESSNAVMLVDTSPDSTEDEDDDDDDDDDDDEDDDEAATQQNTTNTYASPREHQPAPATFPVSHEPQNAPAWK